MGDPLEKVTEVLNFEIFRPILNKVFQKEPTAPGGRPPWDYIMMFKILLLQQWYSIADDITEYLINDRLSFQTRKTRNSMPTARMSVRDCTRH